MTANAWLIALHIVALFIWVGHMLVTPRVLAYALTRPDNEREPLYRWLRRSWNVLSPAGLLVLGSGVLMLFGVGWPADGTVGAYLKPRVDGNPSYWYITFHIKLVSATLLFCWDFWMGAQIFRLTRDEAPKRWWPLAVLMALSGALVVHVAVWLSLAALGVGYGARYVGYVGIFLMIAAGIYGARKFGRSDERAKYMALHGFTAALVILIVILIIARPLSYGGPTVG